MNIVFESPTTIIHDDREPLTLQEGLQILIDGGTVRLCDFPDFSAEDPTHIYDDGVVIRITDIIPAAQLRELSADAVRQQVTAYLTGYEYYKA